MAATAQNLRVDKFAFSSSVEADVWHAEKPAEAYEWWYFDALADGGNEAVVISFLDNYIFSPRYNGAVSEEKSKKNGSNHGEHPGKDSRPFRLSITRVAARFTAALTSIRRHHLVRAKTPLNAASVTTRFASRPRLTVQGTLSLSTLCSAKTGSLKLPSSGSRSSPTWRRELFVTRTPSIVGTWWRRART